jgi:hypothetical protein
LNASPVNSAAGASSPTPALDALPLFTAAGVPELGPDEPAIGDYNPQAEPATGLPGNGLAQHPMLYIGEGYNKMLLVNGGKIIWTYNTAPVKSGEYDDVWLLSNGNILFSRMSYAAEVTPQKKIVWRRDAATGREIHTVQPIGLDKVLLMENGQPPKLMVINKKSGAIEIEHEMPDSGPTHAQFRRVRVTANGTYLVPFLQMHKVVEYDKDFKEIWSYETNRPWAAVRLHNGNTLITDEHDKLTREVNPKGETVWEIKLSDLPAELRGGNCQTALRLTNGNTILCINSPRNKAPQLVEVTPDKKVVWALKDWRHFGPATAVQILDDPGIPEKPGDLQR